MAKEIGFMANLSATTNPAVMTVLSSRGLFAAFVAGAFLVTVVLVAVQSAHSRPATTLPAQELVHHDLVRDHPTQFIFRPGQPY
jgi:hypothetical protein